VEVLEEPCDKMMNNRFRFFITQEDVAAGLEHFTFDGNPDNGTYVVTEFAPVAGNLFDKLFKLVC
jgi:hypothetical protein